MIALYILLGVLAAILLVLFSSVSLRVSYTDDLSIYLRFWFLRFKLYPEKPSKKPDAETKNAQTDKKPSKLKQLIDKNGLKDTLSTVFNTVKIILNSLSKISKHIRIRRLKLIVTAASENPALTGIEYGALCAVVFPFVKLLQNSTKLNEKGAEVSVKSDFIITEPKFQLHTVIKLRVIYILSFGISALVGLVKQNIVKINEEPKIIAESDGEKEK